ncbi:hypothetical protein ABF87_11600 [Nitrosomonas sp. JL21]|uniref:hypothetical protein n=1 Tax=Nitrosomonas sp. JL21 TaxID=153949 RepID=UPI00137048DC|nr:hypothetical protein [Nitrosomonas sp. JL21]MBL8498209.1 hypothetical protein [Nitrosomonas sp.]MCC7090635.1 hypothetical protein [Nitrosomonas sp.]MXS78588.1 hypothetical protein [Nitrosomonas sp. JL21]
MSGLSFLIEVDLDYYREMHKDLKKHTDEELIAHYFQHGYFEGRISQFYSLRENFIKQFLGMSCLEIGPFVNPSLTHPTVKYLDVLSTQELICRANLFGFSTEKIREIDYVSPDGSLEIIREKFDVVFSSHNLEHQPDLIGHLQEVGSILEDSGRFAMIVPNARYCFDADLPLSKISDIFNAYVSQRKKHTLGSVIEHRALTTHNDALFHWNNSNRREYKPIDVGKIRDAIIEFDQACGGYIDVHAWQFDPLSLADILNVLIKLKYIPFQRVTCYGPVFGRNEFTLELLK